MVILKQKPCPLTMHGDRQAQWWLTVDPIMNVNESFYCHNKWEVILNSYEIFTTHKHLTFYPLHVDPVSLPHYRQTTYHYDDVIMDAIASQITNRTIVYSNVYSGADQSKHQSSASLAFVWGIHRGPVNSPHKWPVTRKMFLFDDVIMSHRKSDDFHW